MILPYTTSLYKCVCILKIDASWSEQREKEKKTPSLIITESGEQNKNENKYL